MANRRKMLSDMDAPYIQSLMRLIETQSKTTLARWAVDYAYEFLLPLFNYCLEDLERAAAAECEKMRIALEKIAVRDEPKPAKITWHC
ncbi:MAG: hypothetical protein PHD23_01930 [Eubacteriales bacterium]|nr:hypothetical protein [Eubacteriales bacterium]MDD3197063.1 hypothetical protein [Eubacteriales bacterium]